MYMPFMKGNKFASNEYKSKNGIKKLTSEQQQTQKTLTKARRDIFKINDVIDLIHYMDEHAIDRKLQDTILKEWNVRQRGVITVDEEKQIKLQLMVLLDFNHTKGQIPELYAYCEEKLPGYLSLLDDARLPFLRGRSLQVHE